MRGRNDTANMLKNCSKKKKTISKNVKLCYSRKKEEQKKEGNSMVNVGICDDNRDVLRSLAQMIRSSWTTEHTITLCNSRAELEQWLAGTGTNRPDVLLLDIDLGIENGITVSNWVADRCPGLKILFITGHVEYSQDIFHGKADGFLIKPVDCRVLCRELDRVTEVPAAPETEDYLSLKVHKEVLRVPVREIRYLESQRRVVYIVTENERLEGYFKLNELEERLPEQFLRCHQSYLVNLDHVSRFRSDYLELMDGTQIPISKKRQKTSREAFYHYLGEQI